MKEQGLSLYEIADAYEGLGVLLEHEGADITEYLDAVEMQLNNKVENIVKYSKNLELTAEAVDTEIERLTALKKSYENKAQTLKNYLKYSMLKHGIEKVDTGICRLSFRKSETVEIDDLDKLPEHLVVQKISFQANKKAIKELLDSGKVVPGAHKEIHNNLQIK